MLAIINLCIMFVYILTLFVLCFFKKTRKLFMIANGMGAFPATISINWMMSSHLKGLSFLGFSIIFGLAVLFNIALAIGVLVKNKKKDLILFASIAVILAIAFFLSIRIGSTIAIMVSGEINFLYYVVAPIVIFFKTKKSNIFEIKDDHFDEKIYKVPKEK